MINLKENNNSQYICQIIDTIFKSYKKNNDLNLVEELFLMLDDLASILYPTKKKPLYEMNISDLNDIISIVTSRVDDIFDNKVIKVFKFNKLKLSTIQRLSNIRIAKKALEINNSVLIKGLSLTYGITMKYNNPLYWARKIAVKQTVKTIKNKIVLAYIIILAEEFYNLHASKLDIPKINLNELLNKVELELEEESSNLNSKINEISEEELIDSEPDLLTIDELYSLDLISLEDYSLIGELTTKEEQKLVKKLNKLNDNKRKVKSTIIEKERKHLSKIESNLAKEIDIYNKLLAKYGLTNEVFNNIKRKKISLDTREKHLIKNKEKYIRTRKYRV